MSEDTRLKQIASLFSFFDDKPIIFMGDLNTMDTDDKTIFPVLGNILDNVFKEMARGEVIKFIKQNGFKDTNLERIKTVPTKLFPIKVNEAIARLDYVFYRGNLNVESVKVLKGDIFGRMSDHFPIAVDFSSNGL